MPDQNFFLRALSLDLQESLTPHLREQQLEAGQVLLTTRDRIQRIIFVTSGAMSLVTELSTGQMIEFAMIGRDGIVGGGAVLDDPGIMYKAIVQVAGGGYTMEIDVARQIARRSEAFRTAIVRHEQLVLAQAQQAAACNAAHNVKERFARWLLRVHDATGVESFVLTQESIAKMLGVQRTSVSPVAHILQEAGFISFRRGRIAIEDFDALREIACECYKTVWRRYEEFAKEAFRGAIRRESEERRLPRKY